MDDFGGPATQPSLVDRVKNILLKPKEEWARIEAEPATIGGIYRSYVVPLAAIGPVCGLIGAQLFGYGGFGIYFKPTLAASISNAVVQYVLSLISVYVLALVIDGLAPTFQGTKNQVQAFKVAAYSATASWVAGVFGLIPSLSVLGILGLYNLYLLYVGLPKLMKVAQEKAVAYIAVVVIAMIVLFLIIGAVTGAVTRSFVGGYGPYGSAGSTVSGALTVPGVGSVDLARIDAATKQVEVAAQGLKASANGAPNGAVTPIPAGTLQALLPPALPGGLVRTSLSSGSAGAAGIGGSSAHADYGSGATTIKLELTDLGAMGGLAALGSALNVESSQQDNNGYEKTGKVDGRMTTEKWHNASRSGTFSILVGNRIMVEADGDGTTIDALKAAVSQIDLGRLEGLTKS